MAAKKKRTTNSKTREEILERSILLFAKSGYNGVSMRDVAAAVRVTPAAIYYHFTGKEQLYLDTLRHALKEKASALNAALDGEEKPPWARLEAFVGALAQVLTQEKDFQRLLQWVLLDRNDKRLHKLGNTVLKDSFVAVYGLAEKLGNGLDPHLLAMSIISLVVFPFEAGHARRFLPGFKPQHDDPGVLARHVIALLRHGLSRRGRH